MYDEDFANRLAQLRIQKGVSARDMSLSLGQNPGYINNIENGNGLPSFTVFFYICEYLDISPCDFFDMEKQNPTQLNTLINYLKQLTPQKLEHITAIVKDMLDTR